MAKKGKNGRGDAEGHPRHDDFAYPGHGRRTRTHTIAKVIERTPEDVPGGGTGVPLSSSAPARGSWLGFFLLGCDENNRKAKFLSSHRRRQKAAGARNEALAAEIRPIDLVMGKEAMADGGTR